MTDDPPSSPGTAHDTDKLPAPLDTVGAAGTPGTDAVVALRDADPPLDPDPDPDPVADPDPDPSSAARVRAAAMTAVW